VSGAGATRAANLFLSINRLFSFDRVALAVQSSAQHLDNIDFISGDFYYY